MRNDLAHWNCQDYVLEILDALEEAKILIRSMDYEHVRTALVRMVGPVEDTRRHILTYRAPGVADGDRSEEPSDEMEEEEDDESRDDKTNRRVLSEEFVVDSDDDDEGSSER